MELAQPPQDEELRNIIDKLAIFVARNGPEFEAMTKQKQQGNARFSFLYGGEFYNYYMYKVTTEQAILKHKALQQQQRQGQGPEGFGGGGGFGGQGQGAGPHGQGGQGHGGFTDGGNPFQQHPQRFPFGGDHHPNQGQPPPQRHMSRFDVGPPGQGPGPGPRGPQFQNFQRMPFQNQQQRFPGHFEQQHQQMMGGPGPGQGNFGGGGFDRGSPRMQQQQQDRFDNRGPVRSRFDIGPGGGYDRGPGHGPGPGGPALSPFQQEPPHQTPPPVVPARSLASLTSEIETLKTQKQALEEQAKQSEQNLAAQHQVLMAQQNQQIEEAIRILQEAEIKQLAAELNIDLNELDAVLEPVVEACTKESISGGKAWIFTHTSTPRHYQLLSMYLLKQTTDPGSSFNMRLHIIYLVNDVLHHCMRKGAEDLRQVLEAMVIPMFSHAKVKEAGNEDGLSKLDKLLSLWESKCQYVSQFAVGKLKDPSNTWLEYHGELLKRHAVVVSQIAQNIQKTFEGYQAQHKMFYEHSQDNIKALEPKLQQLNLQLTQIQLQQQQQQQHFMNQPPAANIPPPGLVIPQIGGIPSHITASTAPPTLPPYGSGISGQPYIPPTQPGTQHQPPENVSIPDISRPPPGFPPPQVSENELLPALPYYELPAGLMVSLVKLEDDNYKPLDPAAIRLPPPCPPSERLIQAVEAFYAAPSHERPRDSEGWERLGLYEYFKTKNLARKQKEDDIREGRRKKSKSPSPIRRDSSPSGRSPPRRRYQSKSPTPSKRRRSRSKSPPRRSRRRSRSRSRSPIRRSPTPPSFGMAGLGMETKLDESNKGHQLLKKMGWGGSGLGAQEQGIEAPISGGEVRERRDMYRGVGIPTNDPFESYRKTKGQAFVDRMRARADDRP